MTYANAEFYNNTFKGTQLSGDELAKRLEDASRRVDVATFNRSRDFEALSEYEKNAVRLAVCYEAEARKSREGLEDLAGVSGYSVGDYSVSFDGLTIKQHRGLASSSAWDILSQTRLLCLMC